MPFQTLLTREWQVIVSKKCQNKINFFDHKFIIANLENAADPFLYKNFVIFEYINRNSSLGAIYYKNLNSPNLMAKELIISDQNLSFPRLANINNYKLITYECSEKLGLNYQNVSISENNIKLIKKESLLGDYFIKVKDLRIIDPIIFNHHSKDFLIFTTYENGIEKLLIYNRNSYSDDAFEYMNFFSANYSLRSAGKTFIDDEGNLNHFVQTWRNKYGDGVNLVKIDLKTKRIIRNANLVSFSGNIIGPHTISESSEFICFDFCTYKFSFKGILNKIRLFIFSPTYRFDILKRKLDYKKK